MRKETMRECIASKGEFDYTTNKACTKAYILLNYIKIYSLFNSND